MKPAGPKPQRCAIYTRKSSEHNLDLEFNSFDAPREACEAYIKSQAHEGWRLVPDRYDDGGLSGPRWIAQRCNKGKFHVALHPLALPEARA
jgi:site-specific DNA recombinase